MDKLRILRNIIGKFACFTYFGLCSVFASFIMFPLIHLFVWDKRTQYNAKMAIVRGHFSFFIRLLFWWAHFQIDTSAMQNYKDMRSTVIVANHPSLIDVIVLISAVPHPERCKKSLHDGNNMIIFPEGTRTRPETIGKPLKRGAAQIALRAGADILPIHINAKDVVGLGKYESLFKVHVRGYASLILEPHAMIKIAPFMHEPVAQAARSVTEAIQNSIFSEDSCEH